MNVDHLKVRGVEDSKIEHMVVVTMIKVRPDSHLVIVCGVLNHVPGLASPCLENEHALSSENQAIHPQQGPARRCLKLNVSIRNHGENSAHDDSLKVSVDAGAYTRMGRRKFTCLSDV